MSAHIKRFPGKALIAAISFAISAVVGMAFTPAASAAPQVSATAAVSTVVSAATPYCSQFVTPGNGTPQDFHCYSTKSARSAALATPAALVVIGVDYMNAGYGGSSLTTTASAGCTYVGEYYIKSMPSGWNDDISSYFDYSNCGNNPHYESINFVGASINCGPNCSYIGAAMNDRTSSEKWGS